MMFRVKTKYSPLMLLAVCCPGHSAPAQMEQPGPLPNRRIDESKVTYFVSVDGDDTKDGKTRRTAFATLQKAADVVGPGETVLVTKGVYLQTMHIRKVGRADAWINFVAEPGVMIRGSDVRKDWTREPGDVPIYSIPRPKLHGNYQKPGTSLQQRTEQVFVDGKLLRQAPERSMLKPKGVFWVDDEAAKLYVSLEGGRNPNEALTEVSTRTFAIAIGGPPNMNTLRDPAIIAANKAAYVRVDGFTVRHIADFSRMAAIQIRGDCHHITIENCDVQWANYSGIAIGGPHHTVRHCIASNNGAQGIGGGGTTDAVIEYNIIDDNNYKGISPWSEGGAVKVGFTGARIVIRGNVARNNHNHGLWIDYGSTDSLIENNFVYSAMAGGILNEVTPAPPRLDPNDPDKHAELTGDEVRKLRLKGTIIRNNIIVGTRPPGGGGINISNSVMSDVYNNILYANTGGGINFGGSPNRGGTLGLFGNKAHRNIFQHNFLHAQSSKDSEDPKGRYFGNAFTSNLFLHAKSSPPFRISGAQAGAEEWKALNNTEDNVYADQNIFKDPEHFDFTLTDEALARRIGFDPAALRLDWSEFYMRSEDKARTAEARDYTPLELSGYFNRALVDEVAGDAQGGWTDQGGNDMSLLPPGRQNLDNVEYALGTKAKGALLLDNPHVKPGGFPAEVKIPVGQTFEELNFLYTSAYTSDTETINGRKVKIPTPEIARFIIHYEDGTSVEAPIIVGRHIYDWWNDPSWQQYAALNDNNVYVAWQGPNREAGKVTLYYLKWANPNPEKRIAAVTVTNREAKVKSAFFLLGITGANTKAGGAKPRVFHLGFDGDVDAVSSADTDIEAQGLNRMAFDAGKFVDGINGKAYVPKSPIYFGVPADYPLQGQGTISLWLKADDWTTPERIAANKNTDYTRTMTPFSTTNNPLRNSGWGISFEISKENYKDLAMNVWLSGPGQKFDATHLVKPGEWFNVTVTWAPDAQKPGWSRRAVYFNGKLLGQKEFEGKADLIGDAIYIGVPKNGGQPWRGAMDEFGIWNHAFSPEQVSTHVASIKP